MATLTTVTITDDTTTESPIEGPEPAPPRRKSWWRRKPIKKATIWTHRWAALVLGLALLVVTTSGVPLVYEQEINRAKHSSAYEESGGPRELTFEEAYAAALEHDPEFVAHSVYLSKGVYIVENFDTGHQVTVDPATGEILGDFTFDDDGFVGQAMSLAVNVHLCMLTCEEYVGYQSWIAKPVPGTAWLGFEGEKVTWGALILGITGLLLLFLAVSGIWLWWPGIKRWAVGIRVRMKRGRYARDYDLHQVVGMIAIPLLLIWAITGAGYEFGFVEKAWYKVLPGEVAPEVSLVSEESDAPDIGIEAAIAAAVKATGNTDVTVVELPSAEEPEATYGVWHQDGFDPWANGGYPGDLLVNVDRHDGEKVAITYGGPQSQAQTIWQDWNFPMHSGWIVGPWWRIIWLVFGLVPLLLAITGLSTWFYKRGLRKRRRARAAAP